MAIVRRNRDLIGFIVVEMDRVSPSLGRRQQRCSPESERRNRSAASVETPQWCDETCAPWFECQTLHDMGARADVPSILEPECLANGVYFVRGIYLFCDPGGFNSFRTRITSIPTRPKYTNAKTVSATPRRHIVRASRLTSAAASSTGTNTTSARTLRQGLLGSCSNKPANAMAHTMPGTPNRIVAIPDGSDAHAAMGAAQSITRQPNLGCVKRSCFRNCINNRVSTPFIEK